MSLTLFGNPASDAEPLAHRVRKVTLLQRLTNLVNPYRPYKHYMRGPGPKCREKEVVKEAERRGEGTAAAECGGAGLRKVGKFCQHLRGKNQKVPKLRPRDFCETRALRGEGENLHHRLPKFGRSPKPTAAAKPARSRLWHRFVEHPTNFTTRTRGRRHAKVFGD